jgi:phosphoglycolate phosphatase-like HAD superfamily hydrolase
MLIFDFDGVLMDSLDEIVLTAYNAVNDTLSTSLDAISHEVILLFRQNRYLFQIIGDALPLMSWCLEHYRKAPRKYLKKDEFQTLVSNTITPLQERTNHFFATRSRLIDKNQALWLSLNRPFQPLWDALTSYGAEKVVVLTNKNQQAIAILCRHFNLELKEENIYSGDGGTTKIENMNYIDRRFKQTAYRFIDDSLANLHELDNHFNKTNLFIRLFYAKWGYGGPGEAEAAQQAGFPVLQQEDVIAML